MKRSAEHSPSVSLFPFLAVLLCTMGALVVVLVVINRQARFKAAAAVSEAAEQNNEELLVAEEQLRLQLSQLNTARDATLEDLAAARRRLSGIEDHLRRAKNQIQELQSAARQLPDSDAAARANKDALRSELARLNQQRQAAEAELEKARADKKFRKPAFAVVPFDGIHKTHRRPIYLECRANSIILQPEGIEFTPSDFMGPRGPGNPLASALRAAREYWSQQPPPAPDISNEPYPLLLVRPDGIIGYYLARDAMASWDSEFGYELVDADWTLDFPLPPQPQLKEMEQRAVAEARQRLEWLAQVNPEMFARKPKTQYRLSAARGGLVREGAPALGNDPFANDPLGGFGSSQPNDATGEGSGSGELVGNAPGGGRMRDVGFGASERGSRFTGPGEMGGAPDGTRHGGSPHGDQLGNGGRFGNGDRFGNSALGNNGAIGNNRGNGGGDPSGEFSPYAADGGPYNWEPTSSRGGYGTGDGPSRGGYGELADNNRRGGGFSGVPGDRSGLHDNRYGVSGGNANGEHFDRAASNTPGGQGGRTGGDNRSAANTSATSGQGSQTGDRSHSGDGSRTGNSNDAASGGSTNAYAAQRGGGQGASSQAAAQNGAPSGGMASSSGDSSQSPSMMPSPNFELNQSKPSRTASRSIADRRGRNWALPGSHASVPITRPIRLECWPDRIVVISDTRDKPSLVIPLPARTEAAMDDLVAAVRERTATWGIAGRGMYWKPQLQIQVSPQGEGRAEDLEILLADSGLDVKRK